MKSKKVIILHAIAMHMENKIHELGFNVNYKVKKVYSDFGAGIIHDTIVAIDVNGNNEFQILSPVEMKKIDNDEFKPTDTVEIIEEHAKMFAKWDVPTFS